MSSDPVIRAERAPADEAGLARGHYRIFVRDLVLLARIGVHAHERAAPQRVRVGVDLMVREWSGPLGDSISQVLSYEGVVEEIRALVGGDRHINLVETLAEEIAAACLARPRVARARVRVEKLDLYEDAAGVGVEIERRRAEAPARAPYHLTPRDDGGAG